MCSTTACCFALRTTLRILKTDELMKGRPRRSVVRPRPMRGRLRAALAKVSRYRRASCLVIVVFSIGLRTTLRRVQASPRDATNCRRLPELVTGLLRESIRCSKMKAVALLHGSLPFPYIIVPNRIQSYDIGSYRTPCDIEPPYTASVRTMGLLAFAGV